MTTDVAMRPEQLLEQVEVEQMARRAAEERELDAARALDLVQLERDRFKTELERLQASFAAQLERLAQEKRLTDPSWANVRRAFRRWLRAPAVRQDSSR